MSADSRHPLVRVLHVHAHGPGRWQECLGVVLQEKVGVGDRPELRGDARRESGLWQVLVLVWSLGGRCVMMIQPRSSIWGLAADRCGKNADAEMSRYPGEHHGRCGCRSRHLSGRAGGQVVCCVRGQEKAPARGPCRREAKRWADGQAAKQRLGLLTRRQTPATA
jgi:hypothetical protein